MRSRRRVWMIGLLLLVSSCTGTTNAYAGERGNFYGVTPVYCYDGDTCRFLIPWLPPPFTTIKVRLPSMNTPEIKGACPEEITVAVEAKRTLEDAVLGADRVDLIDVGPAGIYGRHLAEIVVWKPAACQHVGVAIGTRACGPVEGETGQCVVSGFPN